MKGIINKVFSFVIREKDRIFFSGISLLVISMFMVYSQNRFDDTSDKINATTAILPDSLSTMEQEIKEFQHEYVSAINIMFDAHGRKNIGTVTVNFIAGNEKMGSWTIESSRLNDNAYQEFKLDSLVRINQDESYKITIEEEYEGENGVSVWINDEENASHMYENREHKGSICYTLTYRNVNLGGGIKLIGIIFVFIVVIMILLRVNEVVIMAFVFGTLLCFYMWICPLGMAPDEENHFLRGYEVANVSLISRLTTAGSSGNYLPKTIVLYEDENAVIGEELKEYNYPNTVLYSPVSYLPHAIGIKIGGLFTNRVAGLFYAGKYAHAIMNFILCVSALAIIPFGRRILFMIMTFPIVLQEMVAMSPDGFTIALSLLFLAYTLKVSYGTKEISYCDIIILSCVCIALSLCKIVYVVLLLLVFMIPNERFSNKRQWILFMIWSIGGSCLLNLIWFKIATGLFIGYQPGVDASEQIKFMLTHIYDFYEISVRTIIQSGSDWISFMIGSNLGTMQISITPIMWVVFVILFVYEISDCYSNRGEIHKFDPLILIMTFLIGSALIFCSLYVQWTPLKNEYINGIQGRYFVPLLGTLAFFVVMMKQIKLKRNGYTIYVKEYGTYIYMIVILCNGIALLDIIQYYIADLW